PPVARRASEEGRLRRPTAGHRPAAAEAAAQAGRADTAAAPRAAARALMRVPNVARVCLLVAAAIAALRLLQPTALELLDLKSLDFRHVLRGALAPGPEVVIVGIDEASLDEVGRWPWPRSTLAELVDRLSGASAIGFDVVFDQPDRSV